MLRHPAFFAKLRRMTQVTETPELTKPRFVRGKGKPSADHPRSKQRYNHPPGPYSRWLTDGGTYNGSSREGRFLDHCRKELEDHLGGKDNITVAQRILIERICFLRLRAYLFDERFLDTGRPLGELDYRVYMAIVNSLVRATKALGLGVKPPKSNGHEMATVLAKLGEIDPPRGSR
jgi:hypothetical protein